MTLDTTRDELTVHLERAFLVSVALPERPWISADPLEELRGLADTAGAIVVGGLCQKRQNINPKSYIGKGKLEELQQQVAATNALNHVVFPNWNTVVGSPQFGLPNIANPMRSLQTTLRLRF